MKRLVITVYRIKGKCPVYKVGDKIILEQGYKLNLTESTAVCMHSLASIFPYYVALYHGVSPVNLGLSKKEDEAYVNCLDPCELTGGGTVTFKITKE